MASRNLNFPKAYGSGIVLIPFQFTGVATGGGTGMDFINTSPPNDYSVIIETLPLTEVRVTTTDKFAELLTCTFQCGNPDIDNDYNYDGPSFIQNDQQFVQLHLYRNVAGVHTNTFYDATFSGLLVVRNSSTKF